MKFKYTLTLLSGLLIMPVLSLLLSGCDTPSISEDNLDTYEITVPGMEREYSFLYLTDTHIVISAQDASEDVKNYAEERLSLFSSESENYSSELLTDFISYANKNKMDGLLLGGDIIDAPTSANLKYLEASLEKLAIPYTYTLGNHDWTFPWNYMTDEGKEEYLPLLSEYMNGETAIHTQEYEDFTIVAVDNSSNQVNPSVLEKYKQILAEKKPVILMLHVPFYTESLLAKTKEIWSGSVILGGGIHGGIYPDAVSTEFLYLTTAKDSPVIAVLAGHVHLADRSDIEGEKNISQITGDAGYKGRAAILHISGDT